MSLLGEGRRPSCSARPLTVRTLASLFAVFVATSAAAQIVVPPPPPPPPPATCGGTVYADVVAIDQPVYYNRLGAFTPQGKLYALSIDTVSTPQGTRLRPDKRPRPLVLRVNQGECLEITFTNHLSDPRPAGIHVVGMQWVNGPLDDGAYGGYNPSSLVTPGNSTTYKLYAEKEGTYLLYNAGTMVGGEGDNGTVSDGLFGAVNVEPVGSEWYRSQVTQAQLDAAVKQWVPGPSGDLFPIIDYDKRDASNRYILRMRDGDTLVHSDLTAIITGPGGGNFGDEYLDSTYVYPDRKEPFREFTIIFHDEVGILQAFPQFNDKILSHTLHSVRDAFAINYGTGGIGAEILANRLEVGPMWDCPECKYEEFFLSAWVVGDPAMIVDTPANVPCGDENTLEKALNCTPTPGRKAEVAFYPDDPSNVYHSYLNDHVKFRNLHAGSDDHHIFHLHAHQWTHTPAADESSYLDSQSVGQGSSFTYEIAYEGSGNRNRTAGDSIFHCHFYPHFAQGMWSMWRVHDVLEMGTELDAEGKPIHTVGGGGIGQIRVTETRALPDGEIRTGTPIPAIVPIPNLPMAPVPGEVHLVDGDVSFQFPGALAKNPGFPFWIPGKAGKRPPHPPLDFALDDGGQPIDGGLPRHVVLEGEAHSEETRLSFRKEIETMRVETLAEGGEPEELVAMAFHAQAAGHPTVTPEGSPGTFEVNGAPAQQGAPFADPCIADDGTPITDMRYYKAADIQVDTILNKAGWHYPQQRMIALWNDVRDTLDGTRPPEPFFFRAESGECVEFWLANLVPHEYHLDDYQVRTPTDILGQHIHLVKFDVTSSDGAANGFNYEDGTFAPEEVQERICAIRRRNGCEPILWSPSGELEPCTFQGPATGSCPLPVAHPALAEIFGPVDPDCDGHSELLGVQATVQRWWVDPLLTTQYKDRTLHTIFTHDHFGPSTHQQAGLYAGLVVEPAGSTWIHNETGDPLSVDNGPAVAQDGGPTSWQAVINGTTSAETYREFLLEFGDFQLAYEKNTALCPDLSPGGLGFANPAKVINPPGRRNPEDVGLPHLYLKPQQCPQNDDDADGSVLGNFVPYPPCPEAVSADDPGMFSLNYRNEPLALRIKNPGSTTQAGGQAGDLSFAYSSLVDRADDDFDVQPAFYPPLTSDLDGGDPFTPMLRAYEGDRVHIRVLAGAHEEEHNFTAHGIKWLFEPDWGESGYRASQHLGISQWFDMEIPRVISLANGQKADFLYKPSAAVEAQWVGTWGLMRLYRGLRPDLQPLVAVNSLGRVNDAEDTKFEDVDVADPTLEGADVPEDSRNFVPGTNVRIACPRNGRKFRTYKVTAVAAAEALQDDPGPTGDLVYNYKTLTVGGEIGPLHDPTAIMFVHDEDLLWVNVPGQGQRPRLRQDVKREPLILRANAGDCIRVILRNELPLTYTDQDGWSGMPMIIERFNSNQVEPSLEVGLHPQMVHYDIRRSDGVNVGQNQKFMRRTTVAPGERIAYHWYAGEVKVSNSGNQISFQPIEFGATGLTSSDPIQHTNKGAIGALIIEPAGAAWQEDWVPSGGTTTESLVKTRASATVYTGGGNYFREFVAIWQNDVNLQYADGSTVHNLAVNEDATESGQKAINYSTEPLWFRMGHLPETDPETLSNVDFSAVLSSTVHGDPVTPLFEAQPGAPVRFRFIHPGGHTQAHVPEISGHLWQKSPYLANSYTIGDNALSEVEGARHGHGPSNHFDAVIDTAGGAMQQEGDYLYKDYPPWLLDNGMWGILRVTPDAPPGPNHGSGAESP